MEIQLGKTYLTESGTRVTIISEGEDDSILPYKGNNDIWYNQFGEALYLNVSSQETHNLVSPVESSLELEERLERLERLVAFPIQMFELVMKMLEDAAEEQLEVEEVEEELEFKEMQALLAFLYPNFRFTTNDPS